MSKAGWKEEIKKAIASAMKQDNPTRALDEVFEAVKHLIPEEEALAACAEAEAQAMELGVTVEVMLDCIAAHGLDPDNKEMIRQHLLLEKRPISSLN